MFFHSTFSHQGLCGRSKSRAGMLEMPSRGLNDLPLQVHHNCAGYWKDSTPISWWQFWKMKWKLTYWKYFLWWNNPLVCGTEKNDKASTANSSSPLYVHEQEEISCRLRDYTRPQFHWWVANRSIRDHFYGKTVSWHLDLQTVRMIEWIRLGPISSGSKSGSKSSGHSIHSCSCIKIAAEGRVASL